MIQSNGTDCVAKDDLKTASMIFVVVPVAANLDAFATIAAHARSGVPVILCAKGITNPDKDKAQLLTHAAKQALPDQPIAVFSGPSFADEVLAGLPAALVAASTSRVLGHRRNSWCCFKLPDT